MTHLEEEKLNPFTRIFIENPKKIPCVKPQLWNFYYGNMVNSFSISLFLIGERDRERLFYKNDILDPRCHISKV
jgi:hypothetical protein